MVFVDIEFPPRIAFNAKAEAGWQTTLTTLLSGFESTNQEWSQTRHFYDAGLAIRVASEYLDVKAHFHAVRGKAKSFPFLDPIDHIVSQAAGVLTASGSDWQMYYRYGSGGTAYDIDRLPAVIVNKQGGEGGELFVDCDSVPIVEAKE